MDPGIQYHNVCVAMCLKLPSVLLTRYDIRKKLHRQSQKFFLWVTFPTHSDYGKIGRLNKSKVCVVFSNGDVSGSKRSRKPATGRSSAQFITWSWSKCRLLMAWTRCDEHRQQTLQLLLPLCAVLKAFEICPWDSLVSKLLVGLFSHWLVFLPNLAV